MSGSLRLGFGCSGAWGMRWFSDTRAKALIHQAVDLGIREFDTGNFYCDGNAETRLGSALRELSPDLKSELRLSSKTGTRKNDQGKLIKDFSAATMRRDLETSLRKLGVETLHTLYLHGPDSSSLDAALPQLVDFKAKGLIRQIGVCGEGEGLEEAAGLAEVDTLMGSYNLFTRQHEEVFCSAKAEGKRIIAIAPLAQGLYRKGFGLPKSLPDLWYLARAFIRNRSEFARARKARWLHQVPGWTASDLALAFALQNADIDVAITTTTRTGHLSANVAAAQRQLPPDLHERLISAANG